MAYEHKDGSFSVFKNRNKEKDTHADFTGDGKFNGKEVWINMWVKKDKNGKVYYSGSIRAKDQKYDAPVKTEPKASVPEDFDDSIPFAPYEGF